MDEDRQARRLSQDERLDVIVDHHAQGANKKKKKEEEKREREYR